MKTFTWILSILILIYSAYWFGSFNVGGHSEKKSEKTQVISKDEYLVLKETNNKYENLKSKMSLLSKEDLEEYQQLKTAKEKYLMADEMLGKVMLALLVNFSLEASKEQRSWLSKSRKEKELELLASSQNKDKEYSKASLPRKATTPIKTESIEGRFDGEESHRKIRVSRLKYNWSKSKFIRGGEVDYRRRSEFLWPKKPLRTVGDPIKDFRQIKKVYGGEYEGAFLDSNNKEYKMAFSLKKDKLSNNIGIFFIEVFYQKDIPNFVLSSKDKLYLAKNNFEFSSTISYRPLVINLNEKVIVNVFKYRDRLDIFGQIFVKRKRTFEELGKFILKK